MAIVLEFKELSSFPTLTSYVLVNFLLSIVSLMAFTVCNNSSSSNPNSIIRIMGLMLSKNCTILLKFSAPEKVLDYLLSEIVKKQLIKFQKLLFAAFFR